MTNLHPDKGRLAIYVAQRASPAERTALETWAQDCLAILAGVDSNEIKLKKIVGITMSGKAIGPVIAILAREIKKHGWDNRSPAARRASVVAIPTLAFFGGQSAGVAALGTAIAVPLWLVFASGAAFLPQLLQALASAAGPER